MGKGLKRAFAAAKATRVKRLKRERMTITVLLPVGVKVKEVIGIRSNGTLEKLEIVAD